MVSVTDMTCEISRRHAYMPPLDDTMHSASGQLYSCTHWSVGVAG